MSSPDVRADDRVLVLDMLPLPDLAALARILLRGSMVVLGTREAIDAGRQQMAEFDNALFIESDGERVPWRNGYFSLIIVPPHLRALHAAMSAEWARLLAPNGRVVYWQFPA